MGMLKYDPSARLSSEDCLLRSDVFSAASPSSGGADGGGVAGGLGGDKQQALPTKEEEEEDARGREQGREAGGGGGGGKRPPTRTLPDELDRPEETALVGEPGFVRKRVTEIEQIDEYFAKKQADEKDYAARSRCESYASSCGDPDAAAVGLSQSFNAARLPPETQARTSTSTSEYLPLHTREGTGAHALAATGGDAKGGVATGNAEPVSLAVNGDTKRKESSGVSGLASVGGRASKDAGGRGEGKYHGDREKSENDAVGGEAKGVGGSGGGGGYDIDSFDDEDNKDIIALAAAALDATSDLDATTAMDGGASWDDATEALDAATPAAAAVAVPSDDDDVDATSREQRQVGDDEPSEKEDEEKEEEARPASPELVRYLDGAEVDDEGPDGGGEGGGDGWRVAGAFRVLVASGPGGELAGRAMRRMLLSTSRRRQIQEQQQLRNDPQQPGPWKTKHASR